MKITEDQAQKRVKKEKTKTQTQKQRRTTLEAAAPLGGTSSIDMFNLLLRGTLVNRTYGVHKNLYI